MLLSAFVHGRSIAFDDDHVQQKALLYTHSKSPRDGYLLAGNQCILPMVST